MDKTVNKLSDQTIANPIKDIRFSVIRKHNSATEAETLDGIIVKKQKWLMFDNELVFCADYGVHFIYEDVSGKPYRWLQMCTCGSSAVCVGYKAYKKDASVTTAAESTDPGKMFVCYIHAVTGRHADGSQ
jgi:hypothetical protein